MAGTNPAFDRTTFMDGILLAMNMGLPVDPAERPTFHFAPVKVYPPGTRLDNEGTPFDLSVAPTYNTPEDVQVPCAVEFSRADNEELPVGMFRRTKAVITLLDDQYEIVKDAIEVSLGGDKYIIGYMEPPIGMFEVTIYNMVCYGKEEK